jgi:hypothetical protein
MSKTADEQPTTPIAATVVGVRMPNEVLAQLDWWIGQQPGGVTRTGAVRWIVTRFLANETASATADKPRSKRQGKRAA